MNLRFSTTLAKLFIVKHTNIIRPTTIRRITNSLAMVNSAAVPASPQLKDSTKFHSAHSSTYERMAMGCTERVAQQMITLLSISTPSANSKPLLSSNSLSSIYAIPPITENSYILDNACGTGIVSSLLKSQYPDAKILATDLTPQMIDETEKRIAEQSWNNMQTAIRDVKDLGDAGTDQGGFTHALTNFGILTSKDPATALAACKEIYRVLRPGGIAIVSSWQDRVWPRAFLAVSKRVRPHEEPTHLMMLPDEVLFGSWVTAQLENAGFGAGVALLPVLTSVEASSMEELVENLMLAKTMMFPGFGEEEIVTAKGMLGEELRKLETFEEGEGVVRVGMKAWIAVGWKSIKN